MLYVYVYVYVGMGRTELCLLRSYGTYIYTQHNPLGHSSREGSAVAMQRSSNIHSRQTGEEIIDLEVRRGTTRETGFWQRIVSLAGMTA
jgi:hypothetical protein